MPTSSALRSGVKNYARYLNVLAGTEPYVAPPAGAYDLLQTEILTANTASVTFSSLNSTYGADYQHLQLRMMSRDYGGNANGTQVKMQFNSDTGANYAWHRLHGDGSTAASYANTNRSDIFATSHAAQNDGANVFCGTVLDILDPFSTSKATTTRTLSGWTGTSYENIWFTSALWTNTNAVDSIYLFTASSGFAANSRISLYGLKAA